MTFWFKIAYCSTSVWHPRCLLRVLPIPESILTKLGNCSRHVLGPARVTLLILLSLPGVSQEAPVITQQQVQTGGKVLKYTAEVGRLAIRDVETGEPHGYMFYTAYRVPGACLKRALELCRPVSPSTNDENLSGKTHSALCRVAAQSLQHLTLHFNCLFSR